MVEAILNSNDAVRYVALYENGKLETCARKNADGASSSESDKYEELIVNPTLITLVKQRGNIDCGGLEYVVIRYGNFFQIVQPTTTGHLSVCVEKTANPIDIASLIGRFVDQ